MWTLWSLKIYKCLFLPNCTRKIMWLLINDIHEKHNYNNKFWQRARFCFIQLIGWNRLLPLSNLEMYKDWFNMVTSLLKITRFTIISKSKCFAKVAWFLVSLAHFSRFCWQYFSLSTARSIHLARKTCSGFWNTFLTFLLLFCVQNEIAVCWKPRPCP